MNQNRKPLIVSNEYPETYDYCFNSNEVNYLVSARRERITFCQPEVNKGLTYVPHLMQEINFSSSIQGITVVEKDIIIVCEKSNKVDVYNGKTSGFKFSFLVPGLHNPGSIAATCNTLYINEFKGEDIYQVEMKHGKCKPLAPPWTSRGSKFIRLSITKQCTVLASCDCTVVDSDGYSYNSDGYSYKLCEYTTNGNLIKEILFAPGILEKYYYLKNAVQIDDNRYLVLGESGLRLVDENGALVHLYGGDLHGAEDLVVDQNGFIIVGCNRPGEKVVLLNSKMEFIKDIIRSEFDAFDSNNKVHKFDKAIGLDEYHGKLYVSLFPGRLRIYGIY